MIMSRTKSKDNVHSHTRHIRAQTINTYDNNYEPYMHWYPHNQTRFQSNRIESKITFAQTNAYSYVSGGRSQCCRRCFVTVGSLIPIDCDTGQNVEFRFDLFAIPHAIYCFAAMAFNQFVTVHTALHLTQHTHHTTQHNYKRMFFSVFNLFVGQFLRIILFRFLFGILYFPTLNMLSRDTIQTIIRLPISDGSNGLAMSDGKINCKHTKHWETSSWLRLYYRYYTHKYTRKCSNANMMRTSYETRARAHTHTQKTNCQKWKRRKNIFFFHLFVLFSQCVQHVLNSSIGKWHIQRIAQARIHTRAIHSVWQATWRFTVCAVSAQLMQFRSVNVLYARHRTRKLLSGLRRWETWVVLNTKRWILQQATEGANFMAICRRIHLKTWTQMLFGCSAQFLRNLPSLSFSGNYYSYLSLSLYYALRTTSMSSNEEKWTKKKCSHSN